MNEQPRKSSKQFCASCGAAVAAGASFCVECGQVMHGPTAAGRRAGNLGRHGVLLVVGTVVVGISVSIWLGARSAGQPPRVPARRGAAQTGQLPEGHPPLTLSEEVRAAIERKADEMAAKPNDVEGWKQLGLMQYRAGNVERRYIADAAKTYEHVLDQQPKDLDALRALGDMAYEREDGQKAMRYYQRFIDLRPDDPFVRTLVGNIHLAAKRDAEAIQSYQAALASDPTLFHAQLGLGLAYRTSGDTEKAAAALERAREIAPDDATRKQIDDFITRAAAPRAQAAKPAPAAQPGGFKADVEAVFRSHPILGPKLDRVDWANEATARVVVHEFPLETIPPFAREKFVDRVRKGMRESKARHVVADLLTVELVDAASGSVMDTITE